MPCCPVHSESVDGPRNQVIVVVAGQVIESRSPD
jgi:hypothetical protein